MEIANVDWDDGLEFVDSLLFFLEREERGMGQWNGHRVKQWQKSLPKTQVLLCMSCSRMRQWDGELDVYRGPDGTIGGKFSIKTYLDPERADERDSEPSKPPDHSPPEVDSRDRDFDR